MPGTPVCIPEDVVRVEVKAAMTADAPLQSCCGQAVQSSGPITMDQLLADLRSAFEAEKALGFQIDNQQDPVSFKRLNERVQSLLKDYTTRNGADWHKFALFNDLHYVRNLVEANDDFELIVLCWKGGQVSRVHNHAASHCWLAVLDGAMREIQYQRADHPTAAQQPAGSRGPVGTDAADQPESGAVYVEPTKTTDMKVGDVGYINDLICLHSVGCYMSPEEVEAANSGRCPDWRLEGGVTLHLYSPPIRRVKIYEDNTVSERVPGFYSKGGVRV